MKIFTLLWQISEDWKYKVSLEVNILFVLFNIIEFKSILQSTEICFKIEFVILYIPWNVFLNYFIYNCNKSALLWNAMYNKLSKISEKYPPRTWVQLLLWQPGGLLDGRGGLDVLF